MYDRQRQNCGTVDLVTVVRAVGVLTIVPKAAVELLLVDPGHVLPTGEVVTKERTVDVLSRCSSTSAA